MTRTRSVVMAVALSAFIAGCVAFRANSAPTVATEIQVTSDGAGGCTISDPADIHVKQTAAVLVFRVKPADFEFDTDGIKFVVKPGMDDPAAQFTRVNNSPTTWTFRDHNTRSGKFGYEIHVKPKAPGGKPCLRDPIVFNDGTCQEDC